MKKLFLMLIIFVSMLTPNEANNSCDVVECIDKRYLNDAEYIKDVTLYTYDGWSQKFRKSNVASLYRTKRGYDIVYYIVIKNTSITLSVYKNYNRNMPYNSWSVDNWGIYYYYNV